MTDGPTIHPAGGVVDTHVHCWNFDQAKYPWLEGDTSILNRNYALKELEDGRVAAGVTRGILVQAANNPEDTDWMLRNAEVVHWINGVLTVGTLFSVGVGVLYLWVFPSAKYPVWPHFLLLSFYIFIILSLGTVILSLAERGAGKLFIMSAVAVPPSRRVWSLWGVLTVVMIILYLLFNGHAAKAQELVPPRATTWIWYPGDFEVWLGNKMQNRRTERGTFLPPFWKLDNHYVLVDFHKIVELPEAEDVGLAVEGQYNCKVDGKMAPGRPQRLHLGAGRHVLDLKVFCQDRVPAIYISGKHIVSDASWSVTFEDKEWIDATGKVSDKSGTTWLPAACWNFDDPASPPSHWRLPGHCGHCGGRTR
ncbi:MAG TPA: hypothetical protein VNS58_25925 [Puia sp.]|nr:hypothetical protein [Puia sp.]